MVRYCRSVRASRSAEAARRTLQDDFDGGEEFARRRRRSGARLIKKVYEADPLVCPYWYLHHGFASVREL